MPNFGTPFSGLKNDQKLTDKGTALKEQLKQFNKLKTFKKDNNKKLKGMLASYLKSIAHILINATEDISIDSNQTKNTKEQVNKKAMDFTGIGNLLIPNKKLENREIYRVLRLSMAAELDAVHLYELVADSTDNQKLKKVMQDVANEEKIHYSEFMSLLKILDPEEEGYINKGEKEIRNLI